MATEPTYPNDVRVTAVGGEGGKWLVTGSVMIGTFLSVMDISVVNVALPHMMGTFGEDLITITWVSTAYSIAEIIMITMAAWWTTLLGRKRLFLLSMAIFTTGSILSASAHTFSQIVLYRVIQGIGGGSLIPCSQAISREVFPPAEQAMAMAIFAMGVTLAPTFGLIAGGWLVDNYGWPAVFYINVPFAIAGIVLVSAFVHDPPYLKRGAERIDWFGIILLSIWIIAMQIVLERGEEVDWFSNDWIVFGTLMAAASFVALIVWELYSREPIINFRLFQNLELSTGSFLGTLVSFTLFGSSFVLPQLTESVLNYPAYQAGLVVTPRAIAMILSMPIIGRLYNHVSPRLLVAGGLIATYVGFSWLGHFSLYVGFWNFMLPLALIGAGMSFPMVTLSTVSLSSIERAQMTGASSLYTLSRRVGGNIAYAALATLIARRTQYHRARLMETVTRLAPPAYVQLSAGFKTQLVHHGLNVAATAKSSIAMINQMVNQHATMMAYNDSNWLVAVGALAVVPLVVLLPRYGLPKTTEHAPE
jgi:MFS transporter, DHA2 family, multidrug resistance protein